MKRSCLRKYLVLFIAGCLALPLNAAFAVTDTYYEDFDAREDESSIDGIDFWDVYEGGLSSAITQAGTTYFGSGKSLKLIGSGQPLEVKRIKELGGSSPTWIEYIIKPGKGGEPRDIPEGKAVAVSFDYRGNILAADGTSWADTGETFSSDNWYRITLKLDFSSHQYDIYVNLIPPEEGEFSPAKENLNFIDSNIDSISAIGLSGAYQANGEDDSYLDELVVHFISRLEIITTSQSLKKGEASDKIIVQLQNSYAEPQTAWKDITLELYSSSGEGEFSLEKTSWNPISEVVVSEGAQSAGFYYKDTKAGKPNIGISEYPARGWTDAIAEFEIVREADFFDIITTRPQTAGNYFEVTITAKDEEGNINQSYAGPVKVYPEYINPASGSKVFLPQELAGFEQGVLEAELAYPDAGIVEIVVQDKEDPSKNSSSGQILFLPAKFSVTAQGPQVVSKPFDLTVSAVTADGNLTPNYQGPAGVEAIIVSPLDGRAGIFNPSSIEPAEFEGGIAVSGVSYSGWGKIKIKASDNQYPSKSGQSGDIQFYPDSISIDIKEPEAERDFYYVGENIYLTVSALDFSQEPINNYLGTVNIAANLGMDLPSAYTFTEADSGRHRFAAACDSPGEYEVEVEEPSAQIANKAENIEVKKPILEVISTTAPIGTTEVTIKLTDDQGNIIETENSLGVGVELEEEHKDGSALSSATTEPVIFNKGVAKMLVTNSQAEVVTVKPYSDYDFEIKEGEIMFGRISKEGIGAMIWRELK